MMTKIVTKTTIAIVIISYINTTILMILPHQVKQFERLDFELKNT